MNFDFPAASLIGFMLALARAGSWLAVAPPFNTRIIPVKIKTGVAVALALAALPQLNKVPMPTDLAPFIGALFAQIVIGLVLGFVAQILIGAIQAAGSLIDVIGGFSISQALDPLLNFQSSIMGRVYQVIATTLLFVTGGYLLLIHGFIRSFAISPLTAPSMENISRLLLHDLFEFGVAALEIAGPIIAALFLAELVMGVMAKAAPQMNVFMVGFSFKILLVLVLVVFAIPLLPDALNTLVGHSIRNGLELVKTGS